VGGGPGGYAAALYASSAGLRVACVEQDKVGGTCLHRGCIPAKEFLETASVYRHVAGAKEFGVEAGQPTLDFAVSQARKQRVVDGLWKGLANLMKGRKISVYNGVGALGADHVVTVKGGDGASAELRGTNVVLAAGSVPRSLPGFDIDGIVVMSSDEVLMLDRVPKSVVVIGGGAIGCEFASTFADLGAKVTILEFLPKILPGCDTDVAQVVVRSFQKRGITIRTDARVTGHEPTGSGTKVLVEGGEAVEADAVIMSVGRRPYADLLGLSGTNVKVSERGFVEVDEQCRTGEEGVYALGDLRDGPQLAHVAFAEAIMVVKDILGEVAVPVAYDKVPWAIYCNPEVAFAGHSEHSAKDAGFDVVTHKDAYRGNSRAQIIGETEGLVKVIAERERDGTAGRVLGVHMVGPWVTEQLGQGYLAVNWEATVEEVAAFVQPHPTLSEAFGEAFIALTGRSLHG
jgi:dihydrolipoamide dehydrogenase